MVTFLTIVHIFVCLFLILTVLLQAGKGGGMGVALGGGGSQTVFGSSGAGNFLTRLTSITAAVFMMTSLGLAHYSSQQDSRRLQRIEAEKAEQKKHEEDRLAQRKAELDKSRPAVTTSVGGAGVTDNAAAGTSPETGAMEKAASPAPAAVEKAAGDRAAQKAAVEKAGGSSAPAEGSVKPVKAAKPKAVPAAVPAEGAKTETKAEEPATGEKAAIEAPKPKARPKKAAPAAAAAPAGEAAPASPEAPAPTPEAPAAQ